MHASPLHVCLCSHKHTHKPTHAQNILTRKRSGSKDYLCRIVKRNCMIEESILTFVIYILPVFMHIHSVKYKICCRNYAYNCIYTVTINKDKE